MAFNYANSPWWNSPKAAPGNYGNLGSILGALNTGGTAGTAAATTASGFPWSVLIAVLGSLLPSLGIFGGESEEEKSQREFEQQKELIKMLLAWQNPTYKSPYIPGVDKTMVQALMNQMKRSANWGYPAGMQMDTSFIDEFLKAIPTIPQNTGGVTNPLPGVLRQKY